MIRCTLILRLLILMIALPAAAPSSLASAHNSAHNSVHNQATARSKSAAQGQRAEVFIQQGVDALERNDAAGAKTLFQRALQIDPNNVAAHSYLGIQADREGRLEDAERHFAAAAASAPRSPSARNNYGAILLRLKRTERAAAEFEASLKLDQSQASALVNLAQIRFAGGSEKDLREARSLFKRAHTIAPDLGVARALVVIDLRLNDLQAAAASYRSYKAMLDGSPAAAADAAARGELGGALLEAGLRDEAVTELTAAVAGEPSNVDYIIRLGRAYMERKEIASAGRTLESAVARGVDRAPIYAALAEVYEASGHIENAIPAMRLAIERDPKKEEYRFRYGMILTDTRAPAAAVIRLEEALKEFPQSPKLWFALGVAHSASNRSDEAAKAFERAIALDPKFAAAHAYLGMAYTEQGKFAEAAALYDKAVSLDEKLAPAHYLVADAILRDAGGDAARAERHLLRAIALDPSFPPARITLAKLYFRLNRLDEAASHLEHVVAADPNLAEAHYQLGRVYMRLKRKADADRAFAVFKRFGDSEAEQKRAERDKIVRRLANVRF